MRKCFEKLSECWRLKGRLLRLSMFSFSWETQITFHLFSSKFSPARSGLIVRFLVYLLSLRVLQPFGMFTQAASCQSGDGAAPTTENQCLNRGEGGMPSSSFPGVCRSSEFVGVTMWGQTEEEKNLALMRMTVAEYRTFLRFWQICQWGRVLATKWALQSREK